MAGTKYYNASGIANRYDPFIFTTSGSLNVNAYGVDMPISFLYSTQNSEIRQPFNRFGVTPTYKWAKAYLGYTSMNFSQHTFSGNSFLGGGVELTPNKFRFAAAFGRLRKAVSGDFSNSYTLPSYKRMGFGFKVGYGDEDNFIDLILFRAYDDPNSMLIMDDSLGIPPPKDNLVLGINGKYSITPRLGVSLEIATSAINRDRYAEETELTSRKWMGNTGLFNPTVTTQVNDAIQAGINYNLDFIDFAVLYHRIDPGYETLSTYFFNNDREQLTFNVGLRMFENKLSLRGGIGQEKNNLAGDESTSMKRIAGNAALNYVINPHLNFSFTYSNFSSTVEYLIDEFQVDSLNYSQVSESYAANIIYSLRSGSKTHSVALNANYQGQGVNSTTENPSITGSSLINVNGRYSINFSPTKIRLNAALNYNSNNFGMGNSARYGLRLGGSKTLLNSRLRVNLNLSAYNAFTDGVKSNFTSNGRLSATYKINKHHSFALGASYINRQNKLPDTSTGNFKEYRGDINYRFIF